MTNQPIRAEKEGFIGRMFISTELTQLRGVGVGQALHEVLHVSLGHRVQVDQGREAVELLEAFLSPLRDLGVDLALGVEGEEDGVEDIHVDQRSVSPWVALLLLHLVLWGKDQGEDSDDGDVQDELTVPHEVSTSTLLCYISWLSGY